MKNLIVRSISGIVYVALILTGILCNGYTFLALFSLIVIFCLSEFYGLINTHKNLGINRVYNCSGGFLLFLCTYLYASGTGGAQVFLLYLLYILIAFVIELYRKKADPVMNLATIFLGQIYIALPLSLMNVVVFCPDATGATGYYRMLALALFAFIWINDTGAYLVGMLFGKHRLFERISPKKSWEGFFGGLLFTVASSMLFAHFAPEIPVFHWLGLAVAIVILGTWGDLVESLIKRTLNVKDSGNTIPGHGGFLDRLDSLLLAVYALVFYCIL